MNVKQIYIHVNVTKFLSCALYSLGFSAAHSSLVTAVKSKLDVQSGEKTSIHTLQ